MSTQVESEMIDRVLEREGDRFTDIPGDAGGATKYGVTQHAWSVWRTKLPEMVRRELPTHVRQLKRRHAEEFYELNYFIPSRWLERADLRELFVDCQINHGAHRTTRWLQQILDITDDGKIGPITRSHFAQADKDAVYRELLRKRFKFYAEIATDQNDEAGGFVDPQAKFLRGWINRACGFIR